MTGYGSGAEGDFKVEARSSNHRNLYIQINVPSYLYYYEPEIRKLLKETFHRGRIEIFTSKSEGNNVKLKANKAFAREYYDALVDLKKELSISDDVGINLLAMQKEIFSLQEPEIEIQSFRKALETALEGLRAMRLEEGNTLIGDITGRIQSLNSYLSEVEDRRADFIANSRTLLTEKIKTVIGNTLLDESRIIQEVAILMEKSDITEEIVRLKSHLGHAENMLKSETIIGKKLDFLSQEIHRELNTIGSKSTDAGISTLIVEMKHELEKIREQTQNLQ